LKYSEGTYSPRGSAIEHLERNVTKDPVKGPGASSFESENFKIATLLHNAPSTSTMPLF
jgi:hypothetical protein